MRFKIPARQPGAFKSSALYLAGRTKGVSPDRVDWMQTRNLHTKDPEAAAAVMDATAGQNVRCKQPVYHFVLSFDPKDAKQGKLPSEVMQSIADDAVKRMGLTEHQMMIYAHKDTEHPHIHFLVNRIHPQTGKAYSRHGDGRALTKLCRDMAKERGLNILQERARILERERVDDFDDLPAPVKEGEYWQAKKEERAPLAAMGKEDTARLRQAVQGHFYNARDWQDLTARLGAQGVYLERKGQGLILSQGTSYARLSQMGKGVRLARLEDRFGERFDSYMGRRSKELADADNPERTIPDYDTMTPAEKRRAERLHDARRAVARKNRDPMLELEEADFDYQYWAGVQSLYRHGERRITRLEKSRAWLDRSLERNKAYARKTESRFWESLGTAFKDAEQAARRWNKLEQTYGTKEAAQRIKETPGLLGNMRGRRFLKKDTPARKKAKQAFRYLTHKRQRWQEAQLKLGHMRSRIEDNRRALRIARRDFEMVHHKVGVPYELKTILIKRIQRREKALSRVTEQAIRESGLVQERKETLIRARRRYLSRQKELERGRGRER